MINNGERHTQSLFILKVYFPALLPIFFLFIILLYFIFSQSVEYKNLFDFSKFILKSLSFLFSNKKIFFFLYSNKSIFFHSDNCLFLFFRKYFIPFFWNYLHKNFEEQNKNSEWKKIIFNDEGRWNTEK